MKRERRSRTQEHIVPKQPCPECGVVHDCATSFDQQGMPSPGDFSVCLCCAAILRYGVGLELRATTLRDRQEAPSEIIRFVQAVQLARLQQPDLGWGRKKPPTMELDRMLSPTTVAAMQREIDAVLERAAAVPAVREKVEEALAEAQRLHEAELASKVASGGLVMLQYQELQKRGLLA